MSILRQLAGIELVIQLSGVGFRAKVNQIEENH